MSFELQRLRVLIAADSRQAVGVRLTPRPIDIREMRRGIIAPGHSGRRGTTPEENARPGCREPFWRDNAFSGKSMTYTNGFAV
jgi:hypothetical protein